jgi:hypothetical protein
VGQISREDLVEFREDLKDYFKEGLGRVETRLDKLNGTVAKHEVRIAEEAQKTKALQHEIFRPARAATAEVAPTESRSLFGGKQGFYVLIGMGTVWLVMRILEALGTKVVETLVTAFAKGKLTA